MTTVADPVVAAPTEAGGGPRPRPGEYGTLLLVAGLLLGALPGAFAVFWSPKAALVLTMAGPGLVALVVAAVARDRAAWAGLGFLAVAGLATLLSPSPLLALTGLYNEGTGLLFLVAVVGAWAFGRRLGAPARALLAAVLLGAAAVNAVMVWLQMSSAFHGGLFLTVDGRGLGLLGNPVHATGFLVGATALAAELMPGRATAPADVPAADPARGPDGSTGAGALAPGTQQLVLLVLVAVYASAVQLTGGRIGLVLLVLVAVRALVRLRMRRTALVVAAAVIGIVVATAAFPAGSGAAGRLAGSGSSTLSGRIDRWELAGPAVAARPVLGIGPGLYRRATSPHDTAAAARAYGADSLNRDAHDLFVQIVVTTGIVGLLAFGLWLALAARGARGPLAWFVLFGAASLLFQPSFVGLTPVLALALGAAAPRPARRFGRAGTAVAVVFALIGAGFGVLLVRGDIVLADAARDHAVGRARAATRALPLWPEPALTRAQIEVTAATRAGRPVPWAAVAAAARDAARRDPSDPAAWIVLGGAEQARGHQASAARAYETARRWNPESTAALAALARMADRDGDTSRVRRLCADLHAVNPAATCPAR
jgi:hypothetical protein